MVFYGTLVLVIAGLAGATGSPPVPAAGADRTVDQGAPAAFSGSASDAEDDPLTVGWTFYDGTTYLGAEAPFAFSQAGTFSAAFWANDGTSNVSDLLTVTVLDKTPPWIHVHAPRDGDLPNALVVTAAGSVEPGALLWLNDVAVPTWDGDFEFAVALSEGINPLRFLARDASGNEASLTVIVRAHTGAPAITVTSPQAGAVLRTATARLEGRVTDALPRTLSVAGHAVALALDGAFSVEVPLVEGANVLRLEALDEAGNAASLSLTLVRDSQAPVLGVRTVGTFLEGTDITTYQTSIPVAGTTEPGALVRVCVEGASGSLECHAMTPAADGTFWHDVALRAGTTTRVRVEATDGAMNTAVEEFTLVQKAAPAAAAENPNMGLFAVTGLLAAALAVALAVPWHRRRK